MAARDGDRSPAKRKRTVLTRVRAWLRSVFLRRRLDREMREEMEAHLERSVERLEARGLSPQEARKEALLEFGNVDYIQEMGREARGGAWVDTLRNDLLFAVRHFARTPLVTATIVALFALGIGVNVALLTILHSVLTRPAPGIPPDDALVRIRGLERVEAFDRTRSRPLSWTEVLGYADQDELFSGVAAWSGSIVALDPGGAAGGTVAARATYVTGNYFRLLGVTPALGGLGSAAGPGGPTAPSSEPVAVIGHALWQSHFGGDPDVLGRTIAVNGVTVPVVGVAPPRFGGVDGWLMPMVWLPLDARPAIEGGGPFWRSSADSIFLWAVARLRPGVEPEDAGPTVRSVAARATAALSEPLRGQPSADVVPLRKDNDHPGGGVPGIQTAAVGVFALLFLVITCTNVSTLLVGLSAARRKEIAVRVSLGASRGRLVRQLLTESVALTLLGAVLAVGLVWTLVEAFATHVPDLDLVLEWPVVLFALGVAAVTGVVFGLSPALHATSSGVSEALKDSATAVTSSRSWLQRGLVVAEIGLTQPLLVALAALILFMTGEWRGRAESDVSDRIARVGFMPTGGAAPDQRREMIEGLRTRLIALPEVVDAVPQDRGYHMYDAVVHPEDRTPETGSRPFHVRTTFAPEGYFRLMDIPLVAGRDFHPEEREGDVPAVVIGSDLAEELWGSADPVGRRLLRAPSREGEDPRLAGRVVGVVDATRAGASRHGQDRRIFVAHTPYAPDLLVRTRGPAQAFIPTLRRIAGVEIPAMPVQTVETLAAAEARERGMILQIGGAAAAGGLVALFLSAIGLYAVIAFSVAQRTREIGVRRALGADRRRVVRMFFLRGLKLGLLGLVLGLPLGLLGLRVLSEQVGLPAVSPAGIVGLTASVVLAVVALATWIPARRAVGVEPTEALRCD